MTSDVPRFEGPETERGAQMAEALAGAGVSTASQLSAMYGATVRWDGVEGVIDYVGADGKVRVTLANGRQPYCSLDALQPDGAGFTYTTPEN